LKERGKKDKDGETIRDLILFVYETSLSVSGLPLEDPTGYASRMTELGLG
jgi:HSP90 family molecular chaperone